MFLCQPENSAIWVQVKIKAYHTKIRESLLLNNRITKNGLECKQEIGSTGLCQNTPGIQIRCLLEKTHSDVHSKSIESTAKW